ncbi:MAG TPA: hypothetical protein VIJ79_14935 [Acidobacteriaceae bacterium]
MRRITLAIVFVSIWTTALSQSTPADQALLARTRAIYDVPFRQGLINFDCAVGFDFEQHIKDNFAATPPGAAPLIKALQPIRYRVFVDRSGAVVSAQPKLPDLSTVEHAADLEEANRNLLQAGLSTWEPYASGVVLPLGSTQYHFEKKAGGENYQLTMNGEGLAAILTLDANLHLLSGVVEKPMHIELTTEFAPGIKGLVLAATSTNTNHAGIARFRYTYQLVDGFQLPASIWASSEQNMTWHYTLTDCRTAHAQVIQVRPPTP